jgi:hypothetical protein
MCRQHTAIHRDNQGRLHNPNGPAWEWADGTAVHALGGIRLPSWTIDTPDPARYLKDLTNAEQRRVVFAAYGWDRAATELGWRTLDRSEDAYKGTLYELPDGLLDDEDDESLNLLVGVNASPHPDGTYATYGLPVSKEHRSAGAAQASLWGVTPKDWEAVNIKT